MSESREKYQIIRSNPLSRTLQLGDVIKKANVPELEVRRGIDTLCLDGKVERLYVMKRHNANKTTKFDQSTTESQEH